ncbi:MAG: GNAT family N-acetyltransferase [Burkholderiaceae bacterium]
MTAATPIAHALLPLPVLVGERGLLRALAPSDAESLRRHADDRGVAERMFDGFPHPYTLEDARAWCGRDASSDRFGYVWGVEDGRAGGGEVVGCIGLAPESGWLRCNAEVGYWIGRAHARRGLASDALRQVVDWAFAALPELTRITAHIFASNEASQGVVRKCGFVREGLLPRSAIKDGRVIDRVLWATYRPELARRDADIDAALAISAGIAMERT